MAAALLAASADSCDLAIMRSLQWSQFMVTPPTKFVHEGPVDSQLPKKKVSAYERNKRWRQKHAEAYRAYQRDLMRQRYATATQHKD
jgi:hypothetical protein